MRAILAPSLRFACRLRDPLGSMPEGFGGDPVPTAPLRGA